MTAPRRAPGTPARPGRPAGGRAAPTLARHLATARAGGLRADVAAVLRVMAATGARLARAIARAAFTGRLGGTGTTNASGDAVRRLDQHANAAFLAALRATRVVAAVASEELACPAVWPGRGTLAVCLDPLDGSLNSDVAGVLGTIFGIRGGGPGRSGDPVRSLMGPGTEQLAAGYLVYGPATVFAYTAGAAVHVFTLDPADRRFRLTAGTVRMPRRGRTYAVNDANWPAWGAADRALLEWLRAEDGRRPGYRLRYSGALAADFHRTLLEGGLYLYPGDARRPAGRIRLLYEAAPLALVAEAAGGRASTGRERVLDVVPSRPEATTPLYLGGVVEVRQAERCHRRLARAGPGPAVASGPAPPAARPRPPGARASARRG